MIEKIISTKNYKFYSQGSIGVATFLGGPLAAGYLIQKNYLSLDDFKNGKKSLILGIVSTILLFVGIFSIPETIATKVPRHIIPAVYTGIIYLIVEKIHGPMLKQHKENGFEFHSAWKAAGIGFASFIILLTSIFSYAYFSTDNELYENYDKAMAIFSVNESETLEFYEELEYKSDRALIKRIDDFIIPKWRQNIKIIEKTNKYENLPSEISLQNKLLLEYSGLRLEAFKLLKKMIQENTDKYNDDLDEIHLKIDAVLEQLNY